MITSFLLSVLYQFLSFFIGLLPSVDFPTAITTAISTIWYYLNAVSFLLPVSTILTVLGLAITFHLAILGWRLAHLIGGYIRGK